MWHVIILPFSKELCFAELEESPHPLSKTDLVPRDGPALATKLGSLASGHATSATPGGYHRAAQALQIGWVPPFYC